MTMANQGTAAFALPFSLRFAAHFATPDSTMHIPHLTFAAIGSYQFFQLTFRKQEPDQMLIVTDRMGRIRHATVSVAKLLDATVERLQVCVILGMGYPRRSVIAIDTTPFQRTLFLDPTCCLYNYVDNTL